MRLLILSNLFPPGFLGGYELGAAEVAAGLIRRGHTVDVLTSSFFVDDTGADRGTALTPVIHRGLECAEPNRSPLDVIDRIWLGAFAISRNLRELAGRLQTLQPDAVLCFNLAGLGAPSILRLLVACGIRPVVYLMDNVFAKMSADVSRKRAFERVFSNADWLDRGRFIFMSQSLREEIEASLGRPVPHGQIVPGWFDARADTTVAPRPTRVTRFVFASRIAGHKGVDVLLDACRSLIDGGCTEFAVDIFGAGEVPMMLQRITALRLQEHVRYQGAPQKPDLMARLGDYDSLLFPTWHREPFGFIVPEAAVAGCIPIMTFGIGASEWFLDGFDCLKIARDPASLHAAMLQVVSMSDTVRLDLRRRAQTTARRFLNFDDAVVRVEAALAEAAAPLTHSPRAMEGALAVLTEIWRARPHG